MVRGTARMQGRAFAIRANVEDGGRGFNTVDALHQSAIDAHQALISDLWPNIGKNDQLAIVLDEQGSQFYYNGKAIGGQLSTEFGVDFVSIWLAEEFEGGRHGRRVDKILALEE